MSDEQALEFVLPRFDIRRQGRAWAGDEVRDRLRRLGECRIEVLDGQLFSDAFQRRMLLGMLLENVGLDAALELAESALWYQALAAKRPRQQPGRRL